MEPNWKPKGYTSVSPYLIVSGAPKVLQFAQSVFGAQVLRRFDMPDGSIMHAEFKVDDSVIMIGEASEQYPSIATVLHVYVKDVDAVFQKALDAGGVSIEKPKTRDGDSDRRGTFKDPCGNMWSVATQA